MAGRPLLPELATASPARPSDATALCPLCPHTEADAAPGPVRLLGSGGFAEGASPPPRRPGHICPLSPGGRSHVAKEIETLSSGVEAPKRSFTQKEKVVPSQLSERKGGPLASSRALPPQDAAGGGRRRPPSPAVPTPPGPALREADAHRRPAPVPQGGRSGLTPLCPRSQVSARRGWRRGFCQGQHGVW